MIKEQSKEIRKRKEEGRKKERKKGRKEERHYEIVGTGFTTFKDKL